MMRNGKGLQNRLAGGFTLIELLVVISIISILAAMLMPSLVGVKQSALSTVCVNNLHQQGLAFMMYSDHHNGLYPPHQQWKGRLKPYVATEDAFKCPSRSDLPWYYGHGYNIGCQHVDAGKWSYPAFSGVAGQNDSAMINPCGLIVTVEWDRCLAGAPIGQPGLFWGDGLSYWAVCRVHNEGSNVLFGDGHVKHMLPEQYHSATDHADDAGNPVPPDAEIVDEETWRTYWDPRHVPE